MTRPYVIWPLRFSPRPAAMIDFYSRIGLHKAFSHHNGSSATFSGRGERSVCTTHATPPPAW